MTATTTKATKARAKQEAETAEQLRQEIARATAFEEALWNRRGDFVAALTATLTTMDPGTAAAAIANGELHPAVQVDWSLL